jgi:hypothetical protein
MKVLLDSIRRRMANLKLRQEAVHTDIKTRRLTVAVRPSLNVYPSLVSIVTIPDDTGPILVFPFVDLLRPLFPLACEVISTLSLPRSSSTDPCERFLDGALPVASAVETVLLVSCGSFFGFSSTSLNRMRRSVFATCVNTFL